MRYLSLLCLLISPCYFPLVTAAAHPGLQSTVVDRAYLPYFQGIRNAIKDNNVQYLTNNLGSHYNVDTIDIHYEKCLLWVAVEYGDEKTFEIVYRNSINKTIQEQAFVLACALGKKEIISHMLSKNRSVINAKAPFGFIARFFQRAPRIEQNVSALDTAVIFEHHRIVKYLLEEGATITFMERGTARGTLDFAILIKHITILRHVLSRCPYNPAMELLPFCTAIQTCSNAVLYEVTAWAPQVDLHEPDNAHDLACYAIQWYNFEAAQTFMPYENRPDRLLRLLLYMRRLDHSQPYKHDIDMLINEVSRRYDVDTLRGIVISEALMSHDLPLIRKERDYLKSTINRHLPGTSARTPLGWACSYLEHEHGREIIPHIKERKDLIDLLLSYGADFNATSEVTFSNKTKKNVPCWMLSFYASKDIGIEIVSHCILRGAQINAGDQGSRAVDFIAQRGTLAQLKVLIAAGADSLSITTEPQEIREYLRHVRKKMLYVAAKKGDMTAVEKLAPYFYLQTADDIVFGGAVEGGQYELMRSVIRHGRINLETSCVEVDGGTPLTPLQFACFYGKETLVTQLLDLGISTTSSHTALCFTIALHGMHFKCAQALISRGFDVNRRDIRGRSPFEDAMASKNGAVVQFLRALNTEHGQRAQELPVRFREQDSKRR